jgi:hypothetical protein
VEPDNTDCFTNQDECPLPSVSKAEQKAAQLAYNTWTAEYAHTKGMLCALKNTGDLAESLAKIHDFAIVEECMKYDECDTYNPFFLEGTVRVFRQKFTLEDAIGPHTCSLEALAGACPMAFISEVHFSYRLTL